MSTFTFMPSGPYLDIGRNNVVRQFYAECDCDRLLLVDSDIHFTPEDVLQLAEDDLPIVSGVYYSFTNGRDLTPLVYEPNVAGPLEPIKRWPSDAEIITAAGVGAGFLMLRRDLLDAMAAHYGDTGMPWFVEEVINGQFQGEDLGFCRRAAAIGFPTYVDRRVQLAHYKTVPLVGAL